MSKIIDFYLKVAPNCDGLTLEDIWRFSDDDLEHSHDVIQWLFPTIEPSMFNPDAPSLTKRDIELWNSNPELRHNLRDSLNRFLVFLGIDYDDGQMSLKSKKENVWYGFNHNWLRITRVLNCLSTLGLDLECKDLYQCLKVMYESNSYGITDEVFSYWKEASRLP
jgi:hypothetical protein